jgi:hypothetical protein
MFSTRKILQEIGYLLSLNGDRMNPGKLMKELYLIDRKSIEEQDTSLSGDEYFISMHGIVLKLTSCLIKDLSESNDNYWAAYLKIEKSNYSPDIVLHSKTPDDSLSEKDKDYIREISDKFKDYGPEEIEEYTRTKLPEWKDPHGGPIKIRFEDIMSALGRTQEEIMEAKREYNRMEILVGCLGIGWQAERNDTPKEDIKKFKAVFLYVLAKVGAYPGIYINSLVNLLYFIDFDYYEKEEKHLMGMRYAKKQGKLHMVLLDEIIEQMMKSEEIYCFLDGPFKKYLPLEDSDLSYLSGVELNHINITLDMYSHLNQPTLANYITKSPAMIAAKDGDILDYGAVLSAFHLK